MKKWLEIFGLCRKKWLEIMDGGARWSEQPYLMDNGVCRATSKRYELVLLLEISVWFCSAIIFIWTVGRNTRRMSGSLLLRICSIQCTESKIYYPSMASTLPLFLINCILGRISWWMAKAATARLLLFSPAKKKHQTAGEVSDLHAGNDLLSNFPCLNTLGVRQG
jgi:hypothetical protein